MKSIYTVLICIILILIPLTNGSGAMILNLKENQSQGLSLSTFDVDVTPPVDYAMAYGKAIKTWDMGLRAKGIVLLGAGQPVVLVAMDWIGLANESRDEFRRVLAEAAGTVPERVAIHCLHQHDAPRGDITSDFIQESLNRIAIAVRQSLEKDQPVTHLGLGSAEVYQVASNRRILDKYGKVRAERWTATPEPELRAEPEGLIDPVLSEVSFWNADKPIAVLSFYATHPQSYYRMGVPNPDYPGIARFMRQLAVPDALHIHFTGAAGNVGAGKYNDGSHEMRGILAGRVADGMKRAWESTKKVPLTASSVGWAFEPVVLVPDTIKNQGKESSFIKRYKEGKKINVECLSLNNARILLMPGELFVEYQLAAKTMRPDLFVVMAAYGEGGPGYIPTVKAFKEGGYESEVSQVTSEAEAVLVSAMRKLLTGKP